MAQIGQWPKPGHDIPQGFLFHFIIYYMQGYQISGIRYQHLAPYMDIVTSRNELTAAVDPRLKLLYLL